MKKNDTLALIAEELTEEFLRDRNSPLYQKIQRRIEKLKFRDIQAYHSFYQENEEEKKELLTSIFSESNVRPALPDTSPNNFLSLSSSIHTSPHNLQNTSETLVILLHWKEHTCHYVSSGFKHFEEDEVQAMMGQTLEDKLVTTQDKDNLRDILKRSLQYPHTPLELPDFKLQNKKSESCITNLSVMTLPAVETIMVQIQDITESTQKEKEGYFFQEILNHLQESVIIADAKNGQIVQINQAACQNLGYSYAELIQKQVKDLEVNSPFQTPAQWQRHIEEIKKTKQSVFVRKGEHRRKNGTKYPVEISVTYGKHNHQGYVVAVCKDTTQRIKQEQAIQDSEQKYKYLFNSSQDGIATYGLEGNYLEINSACCKMLGYTEEELKNMKYQDVTPEKWHALDQQITDRQSQQKGLALEYEKEYIHKEGHVFPVKVTAILIHNEEGVPVWSWSIIKDISPQKKAEKKLKELNHKLQKRNDELIIQEEELKLTNEELRTNQEEMEKILKELSERNFELDQLVYKISHDLRSPLSSILGLISVINMEEDLEKKFEYISHIENRVLKLDDFIRSMLNYAKANRSEIHHEVINLPELVHSCLSDLEYVEHFHKINVTVNVQGDVQLFKSDLFRLNIIFSNIISNAYKYFNRHADQSYLKITANIEKFTTEICFEDNGIGMEKSHVERVFEMFFRASNKSDGSGLGMYIVKQSLDKIHGKIEVKSSLGEGTTIRIQLPNVLTGR